MTSFARNWEKYKSFVNCGNRISKRVSDRRGPPLWSSTRHHQYQVTNCSFDHNFLRKFQVIASTAK